MKWKREDFFGNAVETARKLIGAVLVSRTEEGIVRGRITECEAYGGTWEGRPDDAAHAYKGLTDRTRIIFGEGGYAYVYLIYGMYSCFNVVCGRKGDGVCVLIRSLEPLEGIPLMEKRRGRKNHLTDGPGKLTMAFGIDRALYGEDLTGDRLWIESEEGRTFPLEVTKRINIDYAEYGKDFPWRFTLKGNSFLSR